MNWTIVRAFLALDGLGVFDSGTVWGHSAPVVRNMAANGPTGGRICSVRSGRSGRAYTEDLFGGSFAESREFHCTD